MMERVFGDFAISPQCLMYMRFSDSQPITDDVLRNIGFEFFEHSSPPLYHIRNGKQISWEDADVGDVQLYALTYNDKGHCEVHCDTLGSVWRVAGSLRMLLSVLHGEESLFYQLIL